jgi:hypothetical protein
LSAQSQEKKPENDRCATIRKKIPRDPCAVKDDFMVPIKDFVVRIPAAELLP